jgi:hypothetical protein
MILAPLRALDGSGSLILILFWSFIFRGEPKSNVSKKFFPVGGVPLLLSGNEIFFYNGM